MKERCKINWASVYKDNAMGNAYGYRTHNDTLKKYVEKIADILPEAKNSLLIASPEYYTQRLPGVNFLFTMFEGTTIPDRYKEFIDKTDYIITPSTWVKALFDRYYDPSKVFVVNHGVEHDFTFKKRKYPKTRPFRYLWVGAPNARKGWEEIIHAWKYAFENDPRVELYIKTTVIDGVQKRKNVILDGRNLDRSELIKLYHDAHCFVFPSRGEGFGLTLAEAMRTGLPCIATYYSGQTDFFDKNVGYPIGYSLGDAEVTYIGDSYKEVTQIAYPHVDEMIRSMVDVRVNYKEALKIGEKASKRIYSQFAWPIAARKLVDIIQTHGDN